MTHVRNHLAWQNAPGFNRALNFNTLILFTSPTRLPPTIPFNIMPLTPKEVKLKAENAARIESRAKSIGIPPALQAALENTKAPRSIPEQIFLPLSKTSQTVYNLLSSLIQPPSSSSACLVSNHVVPTGLFRLPLEIREQIYDLLLGNKAIIKIPKNHHQRRAHRERPNNGSASLLQTCRQILVHDQWICSLLLTAIITYVW